MFQTQFWIPLGAEKFKSLFPSLPEFPSQSIRYNLSTELLGAGQLLKLPSPLVKKMWLIHKQGQTDEGEDIYCIYDSFYARWVATDLTLYECEELFFSRYPRVHGGKNELSFEKRINALRKMTTSLNEEQLTALQQS